jgi:hypothetical protein
MGGSHTFATNDVVSASDMNAYVRDNTIPQVTSATRPTGVQGQLIYETDTGYLQIYSGSGWVRFGSHSGWTSYTPTLTQSATVTKTVSYAKYEKIGRQVTVIVQLAITGSGTANNPVQVGLPFTAGTAAFYGSGYITDTSAVTNYPMIAVPASTTAVQFIDSTAGTGGVLMGQTGAAFSAALAVGDGVNFGVTYEAAS